MADRRGFTIVAGPEWDAVIAALAVADETAKQQLRDGLVDAAKPVEVSVKSAALALPTHGAKHTGLRAEVAAGVGIQTSLGEGARVRFTTSMADPQKAELPRGLDNGMAGWRHPVFGNMDNWVHQRGGSWFKQTIANNADKFEKSQTDVLEKMAASIAAAGGVL